MKSESHYSAAVPRILVVDDDEAVLAMARAILESVGHTVVSANSGEAAVDLYQQSYRGGGDIPLVLLDLTLPGGMSGLETLDALRGVDSDIRVIACSGYFDESASQAAKRRGFCGILPKPYTAERLTKLVDWTVRQAA